MESTVALAPAAQRSLRHLIAVTVLVLTALAIQVAADAAASAATDAGLVQVSSTSLVPEQTLQTYQMSVTNVGETAFVTVQAPVPAEAVVQADTDTGEYSEGTWSVGSLDSGATATLDLVARN